MTAPALSALLDIYKSTWRTSVVNFVVHVTYEEIEKSHRYNTIQYNITLLPSDNTLIARGMFCGAKYTHHTLTPIIKHFLPHCNSLALLRLCILTITLFTCAALNSCHQL